MDANATGKTQYVAEGTRVLLPNYNGRTFTYATVVETDGPNVKVRLERPSYTDREPFWTSCDRIVIAALMPGPGNRPTFAEARSRFSITDETHDEDGHAFRDVNVAVRYQGGIVAYYGGSGHPESARRYAEQSIVDRARIMSGTTPPAEPPCSLFKGPEDY